jgi:hypothetical protein
VKPILACAWRVFLLAFAPIPKFQEGFQVMIYFLILAGFITNPDPISSYLPNDIFRRVAIGLTVISVSVFVAACRLYWQLNRKPLTIEFTEANQFMSSIRVDNYKKNEEEEFDNFYLRIKLYFRFTNTSHKSGCVKALRLFLMRRGLFGKSMIVSDFYGHIFLECNNKAKSIFLTQEALPVENVSGFYSISKNFQIDQDYGLLLLDPDRYFLRLKLQALGQTDSTIDILPDWEAVFDMTTAGNQIRKIKLLN